MTELAKDPRRDVPPVDRVIGGQQGAALISVYGRKLVRGQARRILQEIRHRLATGAEGSGPLSGPNRLAAIRSELASALELTAGGPAVARVLNATGILIHTNLGRSPLPPEVVAQMPPLLDAYCDLEVDLATGVRGDRNHRVDRLLSVLTGAEAGLVVNNAAAAVFLILTEFAAGKEVIISRGELVEIGGSFRIPDILKASGCRLVEVGTTNRTRPADYASAINEHTGLLLKVYPSNYRITGFVEQVEAQTLARLGKEHGVLVAVDEGSGLLRSSERPQLRDHVSFEGLLASGCELVCGSGDKLLGGPQAGLIAGSSECISRLKRHPLYRAVRPDRTALIALGAVLARSLAGQPMPLDRMWPAPQAHQERVERVCLALGGELAEVNGYLGGGAGAEIPIPALGFSLPGESAFATRLRTGATAVMAYLKNDRLWFDLRTIDPSDDEILVAAVQEAKS